MHVDGIPWSNALSSANHSQFHHSQRREGEGRETETEPDSQVTASSDCFANRPRIVHLILSGKENWLTLVLSR